MIRMKWMGSDGEVWSVCSAIWNWYHVTMVGNMNILTGSPATTYHHMDLRRFLSEVPCHHITWQPSQYGLSTFFDPTKPNPGNLMSCTLFFGKGHVWRYTYIQIFRWYTHYQIFRFKSMTIEHVWTTCCLQASRAWPGLFVHLGTRLGHVSNHSYDFSTRYQNSRD